MSDSSLTAETTRLLAQLVASFDEGRLAHAHIVEGAADGQGRLFVEHFLAHILDDQPESVMQHADVVVLEPEGKSRGIPIDRVRELNKMISQTSFVGGWKAGVLLEADRLNESAANAFLKTLEEPPPRSLLFLVTDKPDVLKATILSRCQRIALQGHEAPSDAWWREPLFELLVAQKSDEVLDAMATAGRLNLLLKRVREEATVQVQDELGDDEAEKDVIEARVRTQEIEARTGMLKAMEQWARDVWLWSLGQAEGRLFYGDHADTTRRQAEGLSPVAALRRVERCEQTARQLAQYLPAEAVLEMAELEHHFQRRRSAKTQG